MTQTHRFDLEPLDAENVELIDAMEREEYKYINGIYVIFTVLYWYHNFREGSAVQKMKVAKAAAGKIMAARPRNDRRLSKLEEEFRKMT